MGSKKAFVLKITMTDSISSVGWFVALGSWGRANGKRGSGGQLYRLLFWEADGRKRELRGMYI